LGFAEQPAPHRFTPPQPETRRWQRRRTGPTSSCRTDCTTPRRRFPSRVWRVFRPTRTQCARRCAGHSSRPWRTRGLTRLHDARFRPSPRHPVSYVELQPGTSPRKSPPDVRSFRPCNIDSRGAEDPPAPPRHRLPCCTASTGKISNPRRTHPRRLAQVHPHDSNGSCVEAAMTSMTVLYRVPKLAVSPDPGFPVVRVGHLSSNGIKHRLTPRPDMSR